MQSSIFRLAPDIHPRYAHYRMADNLVPTYRKVLCAVESTPMAIDELPGEIGQNPVVTACCRRQLRLQRPFGEHHGSIAELNPAENKVVSVEIDVQ